MTAPVDTDGCVVCGEVGEAAQALDGLLVRCRSCSFTWTAAELAPPEELYGDSYFLGDGYDDYYQPRARRFEARLRLRWLRSSGPAASLLEVGSAGGFFVRAALAAGIAAAGVELSEAAVAYARDRLHVEVQQGRFEGAVLGRQFDVVCAFHVLEHVADPTEFLRSCRDALVPGGRLALEVPNIESAAAGRLGAAWPHIQPQYHKWHFTPSSLPRLVAAAGFEIVKQDTVFSRFYWRPVGRVLHARELLVADWVASGSPSVTHPTKGDALRLIARLPGGEGER